MTDDTTPKADRRHLRGFASLSPERRREIAARGGAAVAPENRSFSRDRDLAAGAGSKGGAASKRPKATGDE